MNHLTHPTYIKARDLILASEGRTLEDEIISMDFSGKVPKDIIDHLDKIGISLDRVLMALGEKYEVLFTNFRSDNYSIRLIANGYQDDRIFDVNLHFDARGGDLYYELSKPLHLQSLETIEKIVEILEGNQ